MKRVWQLMGNPKQWRGAWALAALLLLAALVLVPRLGSYGFWEPEEMQIAERALPAKADEDDGPKSAMAKANEKLKEQNDAIKNVNEPKEPPMRDWLVESGVDSAGVSEFGARIPFALLALLAVVATFGLAHRLRGGRAGLLAGLALLSFPLFVFQARHIASSMGALTGGILLLYGVAGLCLPRKEEEPSWTLGIDIAALFVGMSFSYYDSGFLLGVIAPLLAIFGACAATALGTSREHEGAGRLQIATVVSFVLLSAATLYFLVEAFEWVETAEGEYGLFGHIFHAEEGYQSLIGGKWKLEGDGKILFDGLFEQMAFGLFPWIGLVPIALFAPFRSVKQGTREALVGRLLLAFSLCTWFFASILLRKVGPVLFPALGAIAASLGLWIDRFLCERAEASGDGELDAETRWRLAPPLLALFVLFATVIVAKDIKSFPEIFLSLHLDKPITKFPAGIKLHKLVMVMGVLMGLGLAVWLYSWRPAPAGKRWYHKILTTVQRASLPAALAVSLAMAFFFSQVWSPGLAAKLSSKKTFSVFHELRQEGNTLGILGHVTSGAKYYAELPFETMRTRNELMTFLQRPERVFALVKASELCPLQKESRKKKVDYYVVDDSNAERVLVSNRMWNAEVAPPYALHDTMRSFLDENPLARAMVKDKPQGILHPFDANFDDKLQLIGADYPRKVSRGSTFKMTLYYKVLKPMKRNWKIFVHFDGGGVRFVGDHDPLKKRCGTNYWQPGDYIIDRFEVEAGSMTHPRTRYKIWTGLFVGSSGNWTNMTAKSGNQDKNNRVPIGSITVN